MATLTPRTSERFCAPDADMTVQSSDGVLFKVHRKHLEVHSDVFADAENTTRPDGDEIVALTETADVLDLLFQYMYRQPQPDLNEVDFATFAGLAEAAEKYVVYSALGWCRLRMKDSVTTHPLEVLGYAVRHGPANLANEAALLSMGSGFADAMDKLPIDIFKTWILFYERWLKQKLELISRMSQYSDETPLLRKCITHPTPFHTFCEELEGFQYKEEVDQIMGMQFIAEARDE